MDLETVLPSLITKSSLPVPAAASHPLDPQFHHAAPPCTLTTMRLYPVTACLQVDPAALWTLSRAEGGTVTDHPVAAQGTQGFQETSDNHCSHEENGQS